jgi:protein phosphatase
MSWNPFKKKDDPPEQESAEGSAPPIEPHEEEDATDPLVPADGIEERATVLSEQGDLRLERVEVWGPGGISDCFHRLLLLEQNQRAAIIEQILLSAPEEVTGFRNLLSREGCALAVAFDTPRGNLASLVSKDTTEHTWPRVGELLIGLGELAGFLHDLHENHGWCWHEPRLAGVGFVVIGDDQPAGLQRRQLRFTAWDQLSEGSNGASELIRAFLPVFMCPQDHARVNGFSYVEHQMEQVGCFLRELAADGELSFSALATRLRSVRLRFSPTGATDVGRKREHNEDAYLLHTTNQVSGTGAQFMLAAVADGMGGHASGEVASSLALDLLRQQLGNALLPPRSKPVDTSRLGDQIASVIPAIDRALKERASLEPALGGMGTTLAGVAVLQQVTTLSASGGAKQGEQHACVFHVGDSRVYVLTATGLRPLSQDHSLVADMIASGSITAEEAYDHPRKNIITRCLGGSNTNSQPDVNTFTVGPAEVLLLCSDGLTDVLPDSDIESVVSESADNLDELARKLVAAANGAGGPDNITVVLIGCSISDQL